MLVAHAERMPSTTSSPAGADALGSRLTTVLVAAAEWVFQSVCGLSGHNLAWHFERNRVSLHCLNCGHKTPGWTVNARA